MQPDQRTMPLPTYGMPPEPTVGMPSHDLMVASVIRATGGVPAALTGTPGPLPFEPSAPVPADVRGLSWVRWPVPNGQ